jgi:FkbM family methyltransferase
MRFIKDVVYQILKDPKSALRKYYVMEQKAGSLDGIFIKQEYYWLMKNIRENATVLDIGANLGDTAIYFAMFDKVKKVISYEPVPMAFKLAKQNITASPFNHKIELYNKAIDFERGKKEISESRAIDAGFDYTSAKDKKGKLVEAITLNDALKGHKNVAIKCDIEGAEAVIFKDADLSNVHAIEIEYHYNLKKVLAGLKNKGFKITIDGKRKKQGLLYAKK